MIISTFLHMYLYICMCVELLSHLTTTKLIAMSDQKPSFVFNNYPLRLFTLTTASPLINSCSTQKTLKTTSDNICCFYILFTHLHFSWFYMSANEKICDHLQYKLPQGSHVFSYQKIYLAHGTYVLTLVLR